MPQTLETVTNPLFGFGNTVKFELGSSRPQKLTPFQYR